MRTAMGTKSATKRTTHTGAKTSTKGWRATESGKKSSSSALRSNTPGGSHREGAGVQKPSRAQQRRTAGDAYWASQKSASKKTIQPIGKSKAGPKKDPKAGLDTMSRFAKMSPDARKRRAENQARAHKIAAQHRRSQASKSADKPAAAPKKDRKSGLSTMSRFARMTPAARQRYMENQRKAHQIAAQHKRSQASKTTNKPTTRGTANPPKKSRGNFKRSVRRFMRARQARGRGYGRGSHGRNQGRQYGK